MTLQKLQNQALQLPISDRWRLVQSLLASIQKEMLSLMSPSLSATSMTDLDPWTQRLLGVVQLSPEDAKESYIDYLETKYQ
ncbi:hypothetical protein MC7420_1955 [Coleofasciculus chthonoplastes PCC 7420]|uniref:Uncharacterized protein n=1 Tax=Coleofasciculus chthonoplastes PCC 7420 TaxID=118168 RepID=B4VN34_9CYAN|nr:hypothetical protein [Coleofasciculus chthonoplastes]EDX76952.1 hypothetical protein MC7420_1955 [Coleofasciculus chthonoplastes PCC 7420]